jgi:hypothetical protein
MLYCHSILLIWFFGSLVGYIVDKETGDTHSVSNVCVPARAFVCLCLSVRLYQR